MLSFHNQKKRHHIILLYTTWNVEQYWSGLYPERLNYHLNDVNCSIRNCLISYERELLPKASAVLFHGQDLGSDQMYSPEILGELKRPINQVWIWVNQESPVNLKNGNHYNGIFNWTATYYRKSDIFLPYGLYVMKRSDNTLVYGKKSRRNFQNKKELIAWAVSDCNGVREKIVLKLQEYLNVTVFGKCRTRYKNQDICVPGTEECARKLSEFKFYLAFENSYCEDYVTEKYWKNALEHDSVPIVFGNNYDGKVAIPGSFINVENFKTVKQLADFVLFLDKNDKYYQKYFDWKKKYSVAPVKDLICSVCEKLHQFPLHRKIYDDLGGFWDVDKHCRKTLSIKL